MHFAKLDKLCRKVIENPYANSLEADQARDLRNDMLADRFKDIKDSPALGGKTVGEVQNESLRRRLRILGRHLRYGTGDRILTG